MEDKPAMEERRQEEHGQILQYYTMSRQFQYDGLSRQTYSEDTASGNVAVTTCNDVLSRQVEQQQTNSAGTSYITQSAFTSLMGTELTYPNDRKTTSEYDALYRRTSVKETSSGTTIASWQFIGPSRSVETSLANGIICTTLNNARTHSAVQPNVPNPAWGNASSDRLGFDGSERPIAKRYLDGGINTSTHAYNNATSIVGQTTIYDRASNKIYERQLHAETRSALYDPFDTDTGSAGGYDSANRLRQYQRGTLATANGYLNQGGGSVTTPISLPDTDTTRTYDLDGLGNWKHTDYTPVGGEQTQDLRQHNKLNEITSRRIGGAGVSPAIFAYDGVSGASNGNLADDGTLLYSYDALNRLIEVKRKSDNATIGEYVYDAQNRRIKKTISNGGLSSNIPNGTTVYLYNSNWQVVEERDDSGNTTKQYVWGEYIDELIQMKTAVATGGANLPASNYYALQDLLYRNTALTNSTGAIVETYDTDAYGNTLIFKAAGTNDNWWADDAVQTDNPACEVIYAGYRYDPESILYYVRHRTYNPSLGRWVQRDPLGYVGEMGLYEYVGSEPISMLDMFGFEACSQGGEKRGVSLVRSKCIEHGSYIYGFVHQHHGWLYDIFMWLFGKGAKTGGKIIKGETKGLGAAKNLITGVKGSAMVYVTLTYQVCECSGGKTQWSADKTQTFIGHGEKNNPISREPSTTSGGLLKGSHIAQIKKERILKQVEDQACGKAIENAVKSISKFLS